MFFVLHLFRPLPVVAFVCAGFVAFKLWNFIGINLTHLPSTTILNFFKPSISCPAHPSTVISWMVSLEVTLFYDRKLPFRRRKEEKKVGCWRCFFFFFFLFFFFLSSFLSSWLLVIIWSYPTSPRTFSKVSKSVSYDFLKIPLCKCSFLDAIWKRSWPFNEGVCSCLVVGVSAELVFFTRCCVYKLCNIVHNHNHNGVVVS